MSHSILSRYIDSEVLRQMAHCGIEPRKLVIGNLAGAHRSPLSGFAVEFVGHREYHPGDDPKHIDWRVYFTRDKYFIKQYEQETNYVCHLALDISCSMQYGQGQQQKLRYAASLAATLAYLIVKQNDKVSLLTFDEKIREVLPPSHSPAQVVKIVQLLDSIEPKEKTHLADCLAQLAGRTVRREIVMIVSDFFDCDFGRLEAALQRLRYDRHEVVLFQVMHHDELEFDFQGMTKFTGLENLDHFLTQSEDIRQEYLQAQQAYNRQLDEIAQRNGCERVLVDTSKSLSQVFADYFQRRTLHTQRL